MLREYSETGEGRIIERGDVLQYAISRLFYEVVALREEKMFLTYSAETIEKVKERDVSESFWTQETVNNYKLRIVQRRYLGKDSKGQDVYRYDKVDGLVAERTVLDFVEGDFIVESFPVGIINIPPRNITKITEPEPVPNKFLQAMQDVEDKLDVLRKLVEEVQE